MRVTTEEKSTYGTEACFFHTQVDVGEMFTDKDIRPLLSICTVISQRDKLAPPVTFLQIPLVFDRW